MAFKDLDRNIVTFIKAKKLFIYKSTFFKFLINFELKLFILFGVAYIRIIKIKIAYILIFQLMAKFFSQIKSTFKFYI